MSAAERIEQLRQQGVTLYMQGQAEESLPYFDEALAASPDEATRDLIIINKASAQLALGLSTPEIQELPKILLRRPNLRGLAAYNLAAKFENDQDYKRARFYLDLSLQSAEANADERLRIVTLVDLGNVCVYDSRIDEAIGYYQTALTLCQDDKYALWRAFATQNLGYCLLMKDQPSPGAELIHQSLELFEKTGADAYTPEGLIDLCLAYLELGDLEKANQYGESGLERAREARQVRNAHYLLGEIAYKRGDIDTASRHFEELSRFYPEFPQLKNLLFAVDLRKMVNFRL